MKTYVINGKFMADQMQGIVRYGRELLNSIDNINFSNIKIILAIPSNAKNVPQFNKIEIVNIGKFKGILWEQFDLAPFVKKHNFILINLCNVCPFFLTPGITTIHDVTYKAFPKSYKSIRNKISRFWHCFQYSYIAHHEDVILTVSNFAKKEIEKYYPSSIGKIQIIGNGWQHTKDIKANNDWQMKYSFLEKNCYFFSLCTLADFKNITWIVEVAKRNPNEIFVIAGTKYDSNVKNLPTNVKLIGFVGDEDRTALMMNCKAFLFPSIYDSFGIPTLEALSNGAKVLSSNSACQEEILGKCAVYFDPYNYDVDLEKMLRCHVEEPNNALGKYSWDKSAKELIELLNSFDKKQERYHG